MYDFLFIGAGVSGLGIGRELASRGHSVAIVEREEAGSGASRAAAGMLAPTAELTFEEVELLRLEQLSLELYPDFAARLAADSGLDLDYRTDGTLVVGIDRDDAEALDHIHRYHLELGLDARRLDGDEARELEPGLSPTVHNAVYCPNDHQLDPRRLVRALRVAFERAGGTLRERTPVRRFLLDAGRVVGVETQAGEALRARRVVHAAGAWARGIEGIERRLLPHVRPIRGQMLAIELGDPPLCRHVIRAPDAYLVPKSDGRLVIGSTMEEVGFDARLTAGGVFELLRGAWEALPGIYDSAILETWTGFRPMSLDSAPILGPSTLEGLWFALGHGRNGILLTPATALLMADALERDQVGPELAPFSAARFRR